MELMSSLSETYQLLHTSTVLGNYWVKGFFETVNLDPNAVPRHDNTIPNPPGEIWSTPMSTTLSSLKIIVMKNVEKTSDSDEIGKLLG